MALSAALLLRLEGMALPRGPIGDVRSPRHAMEHDSASRVRRSHVSACEAAPAKLKVLCLHGYSQNAASLRDKSGGFRRAMKKSLFEFAYVDGPFGCTANGEPIADADADPLRRAWWRGVSYEGWSTTLESLEALWEKEQFEGVFGFSQGAAMAAILCGHMKHRKPKFAIFVSGFVPRHPEPANRLLLGVDVPSLHVIGQSDGIVTPDRSRALADIFADAMIIEHAGGHTIPSGANVRQQVASFLEGIR
ncbi:hypothetical protein AB1Y20_010198 [Prymnesium parvum]|uniref:Serine hydrolase domain-containing protein n=1 Tax=Prymnesium parvum TaxID=97485 RepID=A0AB34K477_PRYPA